MSEFDWLSVLPAVFAAPFFAFPLLNRRAASTLGSLVYLLLLTAGTTLSCLLLAAQPSLRSYCGAAIGLSVALAFVARQKLSGNAVAVARNRYANRSLILSAMLYPVAAGIWLLVESAHRDWLGLLPHLLVIVGLAAIGIVTWRLDAPVAHPGVAEALGGLQFVYLVICFKVTISALVKVKAIDVDQSLGWMTGFLVGIVVFALLDPLAVVARTAEESHAPLVGASSLHWRYRYFYWNPDEVSPSVRTNDGYSTAQNWASPVAQIRQLLLWSIPIMLFLG